ncbi:MAG: hypothetical protein AAGB29_02700 [Planctomycetota bacterium]
MTKLRWSAKRAVTRSLAEASARLGLMPGRLTPKDRLVSLIESLHPIDAGVPLIRLGPTTNEGVYLGDGGYLVPDDLDGIAACFSPGVSDLSGFEMDCATRGMEVFLADASVDGPGEDHERFHFRKKFIGAFDGTEFDAFDRWVTESLAELGPAANAPGDLLLQMDIEGYEYEVFLHAPRSILNRFRVIVCELHAIDQWWHAPYFSVVSRAIEKMLQTHTCVHIHPNNMLKPVVVQGVAMPTYMEFTFLRNDRVKTRDYARTFPHPLDVENTPASPLPLPACWFGGPSSD